MNDERVLPARSASGLLVFVTRLAVLLALVLVAVMLFRATLHRGILAVVVCALLAIVCTGYCSGRILEQAWLFSGRVSTRIWKERALAPAQELTHG